MRRQIVELLKMKLTYIGLIVAVAGVGCRRDAPSATPEETEKSTAKKSENSDVEALPPAKPTSPPGTAGLGRLPKGVGLSVGERAPDAAVHDIKGRPVRLRDILSQGKTLVLFYRGGWCPYCNFQIRRLTEAFPEFEARGVTPVAVSVDRTDESARTSAAYEIPFPVLSDPDLSAHRAFRVVRHADEAETARLKGFGIDLEKASGRDHHKFAVPSLFAVDREGIIQWAHAEADYKVRPSVDQIIGALDEIGWTPRGK